MKIVKGIIKSIIFLFLVLMLAWSSFFGFLQTDKGQKWAFNFLKGYFESNTGMQVEVGSVNFSFPLNLVVKELSFYQAESPIVTIHRVDVCCSYPHLLNGRVVLSKLQASDIFIDHLPTVGASPHSQWDAPLAPFYIKLENIDLQNIHVSDQALKAIDLNDEVRKLIVGSTFDVQGILSSNPFRNALNAHFHVKAMTPNSQVLNFGIDTQNHHLSIEYQVPYQAFLVEGKALFHPNDDSLRVTLNGKAHLPEGTLLYAGQLKESNLMLDMESPLLKIDDYTIEKFQAAIQTTIDLRGTLQASFNHQNIPWNVETTFAWNDPRLNFANLTLAGLESSLKGDVSLLIPELLLEGNLNGTMNNLEHLSRFSSLPPVEGNGELSVHFTPLLESKKQDIIGNFVGHHLSSEQWSAENVQLQFSFEALHFDLFNVKVGDLVLAELSGNTTLTGLFQIQCKGTWKHDFAFLSKGAWNVQNLVVDELNGQFGPYPLSLATTVHLSKDDLGVQVDPFMLQLGDAKIETNVTLKSERIEANLQTNAFSSELLSLITSDIPFKGKMTLKGNLEGPIANPTGQFLLDLEDIQIAEEIFAQKPSISGEMAMTLDHEGLRVNSELTGIGQTPLVISGTLPLTLSLSPLAFNHNRTLPFHLHLNAEGELDSYLHLLFNDATNLTGQAKIALDMSGQLDSPIIQGSVDLLGGSYESLSTGALYRDIEAHLEGNGSKIVLSHFSATDNKNGSLTATGNFTIDPVNHYPFMFQIHPLRTYLVDSDYATISASGPLTLSGNVEKAKLQGELAVEEAVIRLEEALPKPIKSIDIKYINSPDEQIASHQDRHFPLELDIRLVAEKNVLIQGNHLNSEWKGSIAMNGSPDDIQLHGDLRVSKGEYDFNGKIFNFTQGTIHFAGNPEKKTTLYVVASKDIDRIHADIIVKGPANKPQISFRSNPPLSQREVLSYILFNRGISDITPDQGDQLSQSFISLNSSGQNKGSEDFLSRIRNNIGVDRLDFSASHDKDNKDFGLQIGKNLTRNVTLTINQSMTTLSPVIEVEAKLKKNFKLQAEAGVVQDSPVRMSIKWKKDY